MEWLVIVFAMLTVCFTFEEYRKNQVNRKYFTIVLVLEALVIAGTLFSIFISRQ